MSPMRDVGCNLAISIRDQKHSSGRWMHWLPTNTISWPEGLARRTTWCH